jgi:hypothetical protein
MRNIKPMDPPPGSQIFEGPIAKYWFDDGILVSLSNDVMRTVENITENVALIKKITNNKKVPLLIYLTNSPVPDKETREFSTQQLPLIYSAMAMVSKPALALFIMKLLFKIKPPAIPMRNFTDEKSAKEWLIQYL